MDSEEALIYEEDLDAGDGVEGEMEESTKLKIFRRLAFVASKLKEFIGNMITTAGKVVVTILLGSSGKSFQYWVEHSGTLAKNEKNEKNGRRENKEGSNSIPQYQNNNCSFCKSGHMYKRHTQIIFPVQFYFLCF